jgi:hypothetical protein
MRSPGSLLRGPHERGPYRCWRLICHCRGRVRPRSFHLEGSGWSFSTPAFEPTRLPNARRVGVPQIELDALLTFLLDDVL